MLRILLWIIVALFTFSTVSFSTSAPASAALLNDAQELAWASHRDITSAKFSQYFDQYRNQGYLMTDIDAYPISGNLRYSMIWRENTDTRGWAEHRDLTSEQYGAKWREYSDKGYRPFDIEAYLVNGQMRYAGIWVENKENLRWSSKRNLDSEAYGKFFQEQSSNGFRLVDVEVYPTNNGLRYAAIWLENRDGISWAQLRGMDRNKYQQEVNERGSKGFHVVDFESYQTPNGQRYAAIWEKDGSPKRVGGAFGPY
ncbi:hypothetical protein ACL6C3_13625 [Capilliphycus salinus ALCB114379]|uniref:hypothetical protein n=1 Tax=Capilliphycus salinus TaxID=2768948 RepID=UPI0039A740CA